MIALDAMRMALQRLIELTYNHELEPAITNLRTAITEMERAEPVAWMRPEISEDGIVYNSSFRDHRTVVYCTGNTWEGWVPLYTHPVV